MDGDSFARQICAWLDPLALVDAALAFDQSPILAQVETAHFYETSRYRSAAAVGLDQLATTFLNNFRLPPDYLHMIRSRFRSRISARAWDWLSSVHFTGRVSFSEFPTVLPPNTVLVFWERDAVADILVSPIRFLGETVGQMAESWTRVASMTAGTQTRAFFQHSGHGELSVYMEAIVARACGFAEATDVAIAAKKKAINLRYAVVSMLGGPPFEAKQVESTRKLAARYASSPLLPGLGPTWQPGPESKNPKLSPSGGASSHEQTR